MPALWQGFASRFAGPMCKPFCKAFTAPCHFTVHSACICRLGSNSTSHHSGNSSPSMTCHIHSSGWSTCPLPPASFSRSNPYHIAHIGCSTSKGPLPFWWGSQSTPPSRSTSTAFLMGIPLPAMAEPFFRAQRTLFQGPKEPTKLRTRLSKQKATGVTQFTGPFSKHTRLR